MKLKVVQKERRQQKKNVMNSSTKRKKTKERDNKNNDCNQTWLPSHFFASCIFQNWHSFFHLIYKKIKNTTTENMHTE